MVEPTSLLKIGLALPVLGLVVSVLEWASDASASDPGETAEESGARA